MNLSRNALLLILMSLMPLGAAPASPPVTWEESRHLPEDCPVVYDNDWLRDTNDDEYLLAKAHLGMANLKGFVLSKDEWNHGRQYTVEDGRKDFEHDLAIARRAGFRNVPELTIGADRLLERPTSGKVEETKPIPSAGTDLIVREARKASPEKPLVVIVGGPLCTVASAYLSDPSIANRMVVMMTDIDGYNGSDPWANYVVATRCKLVNFGASPLWWPQRPDPPIMPPGHFDSLPDSEITRSMKEVARRFLDRSTRKEKPDRDDGFADGAGTFLLYRPETWKGVKRVRVTGAWSHEDATEGEYHYLDATGIHPEIMTREFFGTLTLALGSPVASQSKSVLAVAEPALAGNRTDGKPLRYTTSWVGNTFGGGPRWVQNAAESMQVLPDGTLVVGSFWDEGGREVGLYKDGDVVGRLPDTHMRAGFAVAANDRFFFYAHTCGLENQPEAKAGEALNAKPICYFGVSRYSRDGKHAPFSGGKTKFKNMLTFREAPDNHVLIPRGVAANDSALFVADTAFDTIKVINPEMMERIREFPAPRPGRLAIDAGGNLWVICEGGKRVASYSADGRLLLKALPLPAGSVPNGLGFDQGGRLLVCDKGPRQQVHAFDIKQTPPRLAESLGEEGGMYAGPKPGKAGAWRFASPTGAGCDAAGNLYVSCNVPRGGTVLRAFSPRRGLLWELLGLEFVDVADADPASDGRDVFTADERYRLDPDAPPGKDWRWEAHTLDPHRYPHDLRLRFPGLQCGTSVRTLGGERYLCQRGMWQGLLGLYRIDGDLAVPSAVLSSGPIKTDDGWSPPGQPEAGRWLWRDVDGDGRMGAGEYVPTTGPDGEYWASNVDSAGDIWQAGRESGIWRWRFHGLDAHRNPRYDPKPEHFPMPAPFTDLLRTEYVPETDTMYLSGQTKGRPISNGEWGTAGTVIVRYDDWSKTRKLRYRIDLPYIGDKQFIVSIAYAGELAFAVDCKSAEVFVYSLRDGSAVGSMKPGPEVHGESGWVDFRDGIRAVRRKDGGYVVFVEEDYKGKSLVYRLEDPLEAAK